MHRVVWNERVRGKFIFAKIFDEFFATLSRAASHQPCMRSEVDDRYDARAE